jgi:hypothetical protein
MAGAHGAEADDGGAQGLGVAAHGDLSGILSGKKPAGLSRRRRRFSD